MVVPSPRMRAMRYRGLLLVVGTIAFGSSSFALPPDPQAPVAPSGEEVLHPPEFVLDDDPELSLAALVSETAAREPGRFVVDAREADAEDFGRAAGRWLSDRAALSGGFITDAVGPDDGYQQWDALLELPLWWPGQRSSRRALARAADTTASTSTAAHLWETAGLVRRAVATLALTRNREGFARARWQAEIERIDRLRRAVELGDVAELDLLVAERERLDGEIAYREASEEARHAEESYRLLTGREAWPGNWQETPAARSSLDRHPMLDQARAEIVEAEAALQRLEREKWGAPTIGLGGQGERELSGAETSERLVTLVRVPLGRGSGSDFERVAVRRRLAEAQRDAGRLERTLLDRLAAAEHQLELAVHRVEVATERERLALRQLELTERGHALGELGLDARMRARFDALGARRDAREAEILHRFHVAEWNQALGVIPCCDD